MPFKISLGSASQPVPISLIPQKTDATWVYLQRDHILNLHPACKLNAWLKLWSDTHPTTLPSPLIYLCSRCRPTLQWWALQVANLLFTLLFAQENKKVKYMDSFGREEGVAWFHGVVERLILLISHLTWQHEVEQVVREGRQLVSSKASKIPQPAKQGTLCGFRSLVPLVFPGCRVSRGKKSVPPTTLLPLLSMWISV